MFGFFHSNRFYFFIVGYSTIFALLAFFGMQEATRVHTEKMRARKDVEDHIILATKNKAIYKMPRMDLTMAAPEGATHHVRLGISLEIDKKNLEKFGGFEPRVSDRLVDFLDHEDLDRFQGPHGMFNLRHDILFEVNQATKPIVVSDVIFREFLVR